jgi:addiction module RelB/DinJ family antitoxin
MASAKSNVNVKIDSEIKDTAVRLLSSMGFDLTTAIDIYLRKIIATRSIPFRVTAPKSLDEQLAEALAKHSTVKAELSADKNNNIFIDKDEYPELHDWAVNG